jgi:hypothetical protein
LIQSGVVTSTTNIRANGKAKPGRPALARDARACGDAAGTAFIERSNP